MPYKTWGCSICGMQAPVKLRKHGMFKERMDWIRHHYKKYHPEEFKRIMQKVIRTRKPKITGGKLICH